MAKAKTKKSAPKAAKVTKAATAKPKAATAKPKAARPSAPSKPTAPSKPAAPSRGGNSRTKASTISERQETPRTRAATAMDLRSQTRRTRAPTVSERAETPRTRAPTDRHVGAPAARRSRTDTDRDAPVPGARGRSPSDTDRTSVVPAARGGRSRSDTTFDGAPPAAMPRPSRSRSDTMIDNLPRQTELPLAPVLASEVLGDPARTAELAALEERVMASDEPEMLVAIASQIDTLGMQLAFEISRHAHDEAHVAPLKPVLIRVPAAYGRALVRAAEKYDDRGSPKRAVYVLFEALRKAFDAELIASVAEALSFILEAHEQAAAARQLRELVATRAAQRAAGVDRKEVRAQFGAALAQLRDRGLDWTALADDPQQFD